MREVLISVWVWTATLTLVVAWFPSICLLYVVDRSEQRRYTGWWMRTLATTISRVNPMWDIEVEGDLPDMSSPQPFVMVCNHLSLADIPVICRLPWEMKWVAKKSLFRIPIAGWMLHMVHDIPVDRSDKKSRASVLEKAAQMFEANIPVMFFPEGTRSRDGRIYRFSNGPFRLAVKHGVPVLPLAVDGTRDALPKHSLTFQDMETTMRLKVFPPVETEHLTLQDVDDLRSRVRGQIAEQIAEWRDVPLEELDAEGKLVESSGAQQTQPSAGSDAGTGPSATH